MGRGNIRSSSATGAAARKKWFEQRIRDNAPTKRERRAYERSLEKGFETDWIRKQNAKDRNAYSFKQARTQALREA